jgi:hypothetical protein
LLKLSRDDSLSLPTDQQTGLGPNPLNAYTNQHTEQSEIEGGLGLVATKRKNAAIVETT